MGSVDFAQRAQTLEALTRLCQNGRVQSDSLPRVQPTEFAELDAALPQGGWPVGALTELLLNGYGIGELRLLMPALAALTRAGRYLALIDPPLLVYPPALAQHGINLERVVLIRPKGEAPSISLWAMEQALRCAAVGAVLAWPSHTMSDKELRRLQLAAEAGRNLGVLYRNLAAAEVASPAALRLALTPAPDGLQIEIRKCRGGRAGARFTTHDSRLTA
jgi:protein ImuA